MILLSLIASSVGFRTVHRLLARTWFFDVPGKADLTIHLTRIMIPFLLLIALGSGRPWEYERAQQFAIPAVAPVFFNLGSIIGGLFLGFTWEIFSVSVPSKAWHSAPRRRLSPVCRQWPSLRRAGFRYRPC